MSSNWKVINLWRTIKPVFLLAIIMGLGLALIVTLELTETISPWRFGVGNGQLMNSNYNENTGLIESNRNVEVRQYASQNRHAEVKQHASQTPELGMRTSNHESGQETHSVDGMMSRTEQWDTIDWTLYRTEQANKSLTVLSSGINQGNDLNSLVADIGRGNLPLDDQQSITQRGNAMDSPIRGRVVSLSFTDLLSRERSNTRLYNALHSLVRERFLPNYYLRGRRDERTESEYKESHVVFQHVFKCGGTTVKKTLYKIGKEEQMMVHPLTDRYQPDTIYKCFGQGSTGDSRCDSLRVGDDSMRRILMGGRSFGVCDSLRNRPCSYFTVLREPMDRIVSSYLYCQETDDNCSSVDVASITDWALKQGSIFFQMLHMSEFALRQNFAGVRKIMGKEIRRSVLDYFLQNLENWFSFIGITEEMDMSLNMLGDVYGFHVEQALKLNEGSTKSRMDQQRIDNMRETLRSNATVMEALYEDIMLYRKGKEIFQAQVKQFNKKK